MAYKKPQIVAKSAAKQSFAGPCPTNTGRTYCTQQNIRCDSGPLK